MTLFKRRFNLARYEIAGSAVLNAAEPAGAPGREAEVAGAFARALQRTSPVPDTLRFGWMERTSPWSDAMWRGWVGTRPNLQSLDECPGLRVSLDCGGYQGWLARRDKALAHGVRRRDHRPAPRGRAAVQQQTKDPPGRWSGLRRTRPGDAPRVRDRALPPGARLAHYHRTRRGVHGRRAGSLASTKPGPASPRASAPCSPASNSPRPVATRSTTSASATRPTSTESPTVRSPSSWSNSNGVACGLCNRRSNSFPSGGVRR